MRLDRIALVLLLAAPSAALASRADRERGGQRHAPPRALPAVEMQHLTTHETFVLRPAADGRLGAKRMKGWKHFLRCHHTGREHPIAPRLAELLYATAHHFGDRSIVVVAGYRAPKVARKKGNPRSPHRKGVACDFRIAGVEVAELRDYLRRAFHGVGVGYYPTSGFIHLDVGRARDAFWIDYSGPGEMARYSRDPDGDLRRAIARGRDGDDVADEDAGVTPGDDGDVAPCAPLIEDPGFVAAAPPAPARTPLD